MSYVYVKKSHYHKGWSSVDNPYGPSGLYSDEPRNKKITMDNSRQSILPEFDPRLDKTTGWKGVEPVTALRVQGRHPAGEPVPQEYANINFELGDSWNPDSEAEHPPDDDPIWIPHLAHTSHWADRNKERNRRYQMQYSKDPISGARYAKQIIWPSLHPLGTIDEYHDKRKKFLDIADAKQGTWVARPTKGDVHNLYTHNNPEKLVFIRGPIDQYGKVHRRDSDEAGEGVAEAFIEHDENIPPEQLVSIPLGEKSYHSVAEDMGVPDMGFNARMGGKGTTSRWSDELPPFSKKTGEPMDIAFQILKAYEDEHLQSYLDGDIDELGMFGHSFDQNRFPFLHVNANHPFIHDNDDAVNELMASEEGVEAFAPRLRDLENELKALHDHTVLSNSPQGSPPHIANAIDGLVRNYREQTGWHDMTHEDVMRMNMSMYMATLKALRLKNEQSAFDPSMRDLKGEPMEIAFQLLKDENPRPYALIPRFDLRHMLDAKSPIQEQLWMEHSPHSLADTTSANRDYNLLLDEAKLRDEENTPVQLGDERIVQDFGEKVAPDFRYNVINEVRYPEQFQDIHTGEPMEITFQLLKERKSPEAWANKKRYDSEYQKTPKRVKYREQLNAERRKRGIYGKGGKDVSHTQGGKLTLESAHANRARHFKNRGTLRRVKVR